MRFGLTAAACIGAIAFPALAVGGPDGPEYGGKIDDRKGRYIGFDIAGTGGNKQLRHMFIVGVPFDRCDDPADDGKQGGDFKGVFDIARNGRFGGTETDMFRRRGTPEGIKYTLDGKLDGREAKGTLKMKIIGTNCRSGLVEWKAKKPAPPVPQS